MPANDLFLLLGSNLGNRAAWLAIAREAIAAGIGPILAVSPVYETAAWGKEDQAPFLNQALHLQSEAKALAVLEATAAIEAEVGSRVRTARWGPRTLDIDILLYGDQVVQQPSLTIPHASLPLRRFALVPLADVAPGAVHPVLHKTVAALLSECPDPLPVRRLDPTEISSISTLLP